LPDTVNVPVSLTPLVVGAYVTVTLHVRGRPRLTPVQPSAVIENDDDPRSDALNAPVAEPPLFASTNVSDADEPVATVP
jgi:hypothetical protein